MLRKAFTLVELLVVISIIALLLAILMPSLNKARENAKRAVCSSNQRQLGIGLTMYEQECKAYPMSRDITDTFWYRKINKSYLKQERVYFCPSDRYAGIDPVTRKKMHLEKLNYNVSYGVNEAGPCPYPDTKGKIPASPYIWIKAMSIRHPASLIMLGDSGDAPFVDYMWGMVPWRYVIRGPSSIESAGDSYAVGRRHSRSANILYCDGHVAYAPKYNELYRPELETQTWIGPQTDPLGRR
ncbi:MAG: hypothetical protein A2Y12_17895 [Planctomycetes bacterium GWF2_42_9]|nr:MAG: hypothetical protein A2Y12_17895 [Planctomycetes bacterium GWF2_42_9]